MSDPWATRKTLLLRVRNRADHDAWREFDQLYRQLITAMGFKKGLQRDDAENLAQEVMLKVSQALPTFDYDPEGKGRFRSWLFTITYHELVSLQRRKRRQPQGSGADEVQDMLEEQPTREQEDEWDREYRQHLFEAALRNVRTAVRPIVFEVFEQSYRHGKDNETLAKNYKLTYQDVANYKHRVLKKLAEEIRRLGGE